MRAVFLKKGREFKPSVVFHCDYIQNKPPFVRYIPFFPLTTVHSDTKYTFYFFINNPPFYLPRADDGREIAGSGARAGLFILLFN